jgi:hypothetical protein
MVEDILKNLLDSFNSYIAKITPHISSSFPELIIFTLGIALYGIIIYNFYRFVAKRDIFHLGFIEKHRIKKAEQTHSRVLNFILSLIKYGFIFPVIVFFWFVGFSLLLFILAKGVSIELILLISITIVSAIRVTSYYTEDLSRELAKTLPLTLLAIALTDPNFFSFSMIWERIATIDIFIPKMVAYIIFTILIEWILRIVLFIKKKVLGQRQISLDVYVEKESKS